MNRDLDYVLNYMTKYVKNIYMHDSEPMLNYKDIEIVLKYITDLQKENEMLKKPIIMNWENAHKIEVKSPLQARIDKAIEYIEELISDTKGIINSYNYEDKEDTIKRYIEDLETDIKNYEYLEYILRGENESN